MNSRPLQWTLLIDSGGSHPVITRRLHHASRNRFRKKGIALRRGPASPCRGLFLCIDRLALHYPFCISIWLMLIDPLNPALLSYSWYVCQTLHSCTTHAVYSDNGSRLNLEIGSNFSNTRSSIPQISKKKKAASHFWLMTVEFVG